MTASSLLQRLPNEIIHMVCEQLSCSFEARDIPHLRLVCKRFADIGNYYLLTETHLFVKSSQFEQLRQISEHPIISKKVDTLFYEADTLEDYGSMQDWEARAYVPNSMPLDGLLPDSPNASERDQRAYKRGLRADVLLRRAYDRYIGYLADQKSMRLKDYNVEMLKDAMVKMPNLKTIEMSTQCCLNNGRSGRMEQAFKDGGSAPYGGTHAEEGCGVGQLRSLLLAADAAGLKFETLSAGKVDWQFFMESSKQNLDALHKMQSALRSLRTLKLYISTSSEYDDDLFFDELNHVMVPECARYLHETSHLKDFVTATPDLERLDLNFDCDEPYPPATLCDCVGTFRWHSLRVAAFAFISADEDCLAAFFTRHAGTLRKIRLETILLTTGSWACLLQRARRALKLEQASLSSTLRSKDPEEWYDLDFPAGLNGGKKAKIQVVVEEYLVKGGDGPLLDLDALAEEYLGIYDWTDDDDLCDYWVDSGSDEAIMDRF